MRSRLALAGPLLVLALVVATSGHAHAQDSAKDTSASTAKPSAVSAAGAMTGVGDKLKASKKHMWLADKGARQATVDVAAREAFDRELEKRIGAEPAAVVNIFNTWTHETVVIAVDKAAHRGGTSRARQRIVRARDKTDEVGSWHLRCHFTNEPAQMDARLFQVLIEAAHHFDVGRIEIISGFRAPKYNLTLRKKGRQVARRSHHTLGEAVDFRLPGVTTPKLRDWARRLKLGGVGYYPSSGFVHVDVGKVRTWRGD